MGGVLGWSSWSRLGASGRRAAGRRATIVEGALAAVLTAAASWLVAAGVASASTVNVSTVAQLQSAVTGAHSGDEIVLAPGAYAVEHSLEIPTSIALRGPSAAPGASISGASIPSKNENNDVIDVPAMATVTIADLTVTGAGSEGVGLDSLGTLALSSSTFTGNAGTAVWIAPGSTAKIVNSTVASNSFIGVRSGGTTTILNSTIAANAGGGIANSELMSYTALQSSIVYGNGSASAQMGDCIAPVDSSDRSLDGDGTCGVGALSKTNPQLGALAANGGPTQTQAIAASSPAYNAGDASICPPIDQRHVGRVGHCDLGAYGLDQTPPVVKVPESIVASATGPSGAAVTYTVTATDPDDTVASLSCTPASGSTFALGTTTVRCSATDSNGNSSTASFTIAVKDPPPAISGVPANIAVDATGPSGALVTYADPTATDVVEGSVPVSCSPPSGSTFSLGATTVTCTASNKSGASSSATFTVTVVHNPPGGLGCVASDGKISGRGPSFQSPLQTALAQGFRDDVCGPTPGSSGDPAGNTMVAYDYPQAVNGGGAGIGSGQQAASCRTDAFGAGDIPYTEATLSALDEAPGALGGCAIAWTPPYQPTPGPFPSSSDGPNPIMSYPVGGSAVAILVNLTASDCGGTAPGSLRLTGVQLSRLLGGDVAKWNDASLTSENPSLSACNIAVARVVRADPATSTSLLKSYLERADGARSTSSSCAVEGGSPTPWSAYAGAGTAWPDTGACSALTSAGAGGAAALISKLKATPGGIGYAELASAATEATALIVPSLQDATGSSFQSPRSGRAANCNFGVLGLPGSTASDAVGLDSSDNWATDNPAGNHVNATDLGSAYPICGLSFELVYAGLSNAAIPDPIGRLTADQRRTLYAYQLYALSSLGQNRLGSAFFAALPSGWLVKLRSGFQLNY